jgi:two-component system, cell cycle response regulator DivK
VSVSGFVSSAPTSSPPPPPVSSGPRGCKVDGLASAPLILVVDDYDDARQMYSECLGVMGYRVAEAAHGQEALDLIAKEKPALVLMDLAMPVLDGWKATQIIKADATTSHGP